MNMVFGTIVDESKKAGVALTGFKQQITSVKDLVNAFTGSLNLAATGTKALSIALNTLTNVLGAIAINAAIMAISKLIHYQEEAKIKADNLRESAIESTSKYQEEANSIDELAQQYTNLISSTDEVESIKSELITIQDEINSKYDEEAEKIDLLNGKYTENVRLLEERKRANAQDFIEANKLAIEQAQKNLNTQSAQYVNAGLGKEPITLYGTSEERLEQLKQFRTFYADYEKRNDKIYDKINQQTIELEKQVETDKEIIKQAEEYQKVIDNSKENTRVTRAEFEELSDKIIKANQNLSKLMNNPDESEDDIQKAQEELEDLKAQMTLSFGMLPQYEFEIKLLFDAVQSGANESIKSIEDYKSSFNDLLTNAQDVKNSVVDIEKAMQSLANGERITSEDAWKIIGLDTSGILSDIQVVNGEYQFSMQELIKLKDSYVNQITESIDTSIESMTSDLKKIPDELESAKKELARISRTQVNSISDARIRNAAYSKVKELSAKQEEINRLLGRENALRQEIESHLGNTVNQLEAVVKATEKEIKNVEKQIKNLENQKKAEEERLKQRTKPIDATIDGLKEEKEQVEKVKEGLEEQLDILEKQKDALEEIIDSYSTAVNAIEDVVNGEIDSLEQQRKALEDNYNSQIENLKAIENQKDKENDLLEKQIAMQQKLNDLEEARRKKTVRTYSAEQGWTYEVDRDVVAKAESEYESAKKAYEEERHKQEFDANIKAIEDERDAALEAFDVEIKAYEEYLTSWKEILEEETKAEEQRTAQQLLGLDWREKIKKKDSQLLKTFSNDLSTYNTQLKNLVNVEIANLKASIEQKNKEVKAIEEQISAQNKLKESIEKESKAITDALDAQIQPLNDYKNTLNETLNNAQNEINEFNGMMWTMRDTVNESINQMNNKVDEFEHKMWEQMNKAKLWTGEFAEKFEEVFGHDWGSGLVNNAIENLRNKFRDMGIQGFANGGTVSYTGVAQVHGTPTSAETVFNASQSKSLYNMVKSGDFARLVAEKAVQGINLSATGSTNNNSKTININGMTIKADNPQQFHSQFMYEIGKYWDVKLTESKVYDI